MQTALRQQEKIERYEADLDELQIRLEEQNEVVAEAIERQEENEARAEAAELEVDELKSQLADYQQALDVQQTRAIQYNQAIAALNRAKELCHLPDLTADSAAEWLETFQAKELEATEKMLSLEQKNEQWRKPRTASLSRLISWWWQSTARWRVTRRGMSLANYCAKGSISVTWQSRFNRCGCA